MITAKCSKCGDTELLFDQAKHGYDGFVCHSFRSADKNALKHVKCEKCGGEIFSADISIEVEEKEQFIEECVNEYPEEFSEEDFADAFGWFTLTAKCAKCGLNNEVIDLELS